MLCYTISAIIGFYLSAKIAPWPNLQCSIVAFKFYRELSWKNTSVKPNFMLREGEGIENKRKAMRCLFSIASNVSVCLP